MTALMSCPACYAMYAVGKRCPRCSPEAGAKTQLEVESPVAATPGRGDGPMAEPESQLSTPETTHAE